MTPALATMYRLNSRGGAGLACDKKGVALGPIALVDALSSNGRCVYRARPAQEIARALALAYGPFSADDLARRLSGLDVAARALEAGDLAKAGIATVLLKLPPLTTEAFAKLAREPTLRKYSPDQPRDERGRWTDEDAAAQPFASQTRVAQKILIPGRAPFLLQDPPKLPQFKEPIPRLSGAEGAKNVPSWARGIRPRVGESGKDFAKRLLDEKYGPGNWKEDDGPSSEFSQIKKWGDRSFRDPKSVLTSDDEA